MENTAWDRELSAFICVAATVRDLLPSDITSLMSMNDVTASFDRPSTYGPRLLCSLTFSECLPLQEVRVEKYVYFTDIFFPLLACPPSLFFPPHFSPAPLLFLSLLSPSSPLSPSLSLPSLFNLSLSLLSYRFSPYFFSHPHPSQVIVLIDRGLPFRA